MRQRAGRGEGDAEAGAVLLVLETPHHGEGAVVTAEHPEAVASRGLEGPTLPSPRPRPRQLDQRHQ